jgi:hypothetical protein
MASGFTAAQTGRTHDRTRPMLQQRQKVLGLTEQFSGLDYQATADQFGIFSAADINDAGAERMSKEKNGLEFEGLVPSTLFREFIELAQTTISPEKRVLYLKMAMVLHQMALRWEKKDQGRGVDPIAIECLLLAQSGHHKCAK